MSRIDSKWSNTGLLTLIALLFAGLAPANVAVAADEEAAIEEVVVTGSRIKRTGMETASPISVFTSADIEASGLTTIEDFIQKAIVTKNWSYRRSKFMAFVAEYFSITLMTVLPFSSLIFVIKISLQYFMGY